MSLTQQVAQEILDDPAANDGVVGHDQDGDDGVDPAAEFQPLAGAEGGESTYGALARHAANGGLRYDHGVAKGQGQDDVDQQKNTAAIFGGQIGEPPDIAQAYRGPGSGQDKPDFSGKSAAFLFLVHVFLLSLAG